jgi:hypothetical protein
VEGLMSFDPVGQHLAHRMHSDLGPGRCVWGCQVEVRRRTVEGAAVDVHGGGGHSDCVERAAAAADGTPNERAALDLRSRAMWEGVRGGGVELRGGWAAAGRLRPPCGEQRGGGRPHRRVQALGGCGLARPSVVDGPDHGRLLGGGDEDRRGQQQQQQQQQPDVWPGASGGRCNGSLAILGPRNGGSLLIIPRPWRSGTHLRLQLPKVGGSTPRVRGTFSPDFSGATEKQRSRVRPGHEERRSLMTAIEESKQAGSLVRETGRISSEVEDTQKRPHGFPGMKPKHLQPHMW